MIPFDRARPKLFGLFQYGIGNLEIVYYVNTQINIICLFVLQE